MESSNQSQPVYLDLATESEDPSVTEIETVCFNCFEKGTTRLLLTVIPHFREVMISSFACPHCHHSNNSLLNTGALQDKGIKLTLLVRDVRDLKRMLVKSDYATIKVPEVQLEVPCGGEKGGITTVEGVLSSVCEGLRLNQDARREQDPQTAEQIDAFLARMQELMDGAVNFTLEINDPSGNSHIERLGSNGFTDPQVSSREYERNTAQNETLGLALPTTEDNSLGEIQEDDEENEATPEQDVTEPPALDTSADAKCPAHTQSSVNLQTQEDATCTQVNREAPANTETPADLATTTTEDVTASSDAEDAASTAVGDDEVMQFGSLCEACYRPATTKMKLTKIPHFKEVVIMATTCDHCGSRSSEVKSGGGIADKGRRITLMLDEVAIDMTRDVLKSDQCSVEIPDLELHVGAGILGGKFTTLEGLLVSIKEDMQKNPFFVGDSIEESRKLTVNNLLEKLDKIMAGDMKLTIVLDDPSGNSYMQNIYAPDPDPNMTVTEYTRSYEQNEDLGLNDIKTEGYEHE